MNIERVLVILSGLSKKQGMKDIPTHNEMPGRNSPGNKEIVQ